MQYITSLLSSTPPPPATTSPLKVRVDSPVVEVEYTTTCSTVGIVENVIDLVDSRLQFSVLEDGRGVAGRSGGHGQSKYDKVTTHIRHTFSQVAAGKGDATPAKFGWYHFPYHQVDAANLPSRLRSRHHDGSRRIGYADCVMINPRTTVALIPIISCISKGGGRYISRLFRLYVNYSSVICHYIT